MAAPNRLAIAGSRGEVAGSELYESTRGQPMTGLPARLRSPSSSACRSSKRDATQPKRAHTTRKSAGVCSLASPAPVNLDLADWKQHDNAKGIVTGVADAEPSTFRYSVIATNLAGSANAGPFDVTVKPPRRSTA